MNNKIYIAGKISGDAKYWDKFTKAAEKAETAQFFGRYGIDVFMKTGQCEFRAVNPVDFRFRGLPLAVWPWWVAMVICVWHLLWCSSVYMLRDWRESRGAKIENNVAQWMGKKIVYEEDEAGTEQQ